MAIGGINDYGNYIDFDFSRVSRVSEDASLAAQEKHTVPDTMDLSSDIESDNGKSGVGREGRSTTPETEYNFNLKRGKEYNLIGARSEAEDIDVDKAVSAINRDSVLGKYKYFVKPTLIDNEDGTVRRVIK